MRWVFAGILILHGLIHLMGFAKAFGVARLTHLTRSISPGMGLLWLGAAALMILTAAMLVVRSEHWWMAGAAALVCSQVVVVSSWTDAWAGTIVNVHAARGGVVRVSDGWSPQLSRSVRSRDRGESRTGGSGVTGHRGRPHATSGAGASATFGLSVSSAQPRVHNYRLRFRGRIRSEPDAAWMPFEADQHSDADDHSRLFLMHARMHGIPVQAFHRLIDGHATMQVTLAGVVRIADARGDVMDRSETVTLFNDMCVLAPATLLDQRIAWEPIDATTVRARFTSGAQTISATLVFGADGLLTNFVSDDRSRASSDGKSFTRLRFSTPVRDYRDFGAARLAAHGEARWLLPEGEFTYGEFDLQSVEYNGGAAAIE